MHRLSLIQCSGTGACHTFTQDLASSFTVGLVAEVSAQLPNLPINALQWQNLLARLTRRARYRGSQKGHRSRDDINIVQNTDPSCFQFGTTVSACSKINKKNICLDIGDAESSLVIVQWSNNVTYGRQHVDWHCPYC